MSDLFAPGTAAKATKKTGPVRSAISSAIPVPVLPASISIEDRMKYLACMMAVGTSKTETVASWKIYILSYTHMMFPAIGADYPKTIYSVMTLDDDHIKRVLAAYDSLASVSTEDGSGDLSEAERNFNSCPIIPGGPMIDDKAFTRNLPDECTGKVLASHYSLLLFMAGKRVEGADHTSITRQRPDALIRKAHLKDDPYVLKGHLRFSDVSHTLINSAWQELAALRGICFRAFAEFEAEATDQIQDLVYTTMHLLRYSGMQHAKIVHDFLKAYPWAREVPSLGTAIAKYDESIVAAAKYPVSVQPYIKLIYGDKAGIFPRKEMEVLIACAVATVVEVSPDITGFYTSDAFAPIVEAFMSERERRGSIRTLRTRVQEKSLIDRLGSKKPVATPATTEETSSEEEESEDEAEDE